METREILIIGGGIIGMAIGLELRHRGAQVTILNRNFAEAAAHAAAGMLAPAAEGIPAGAMQSLCRRSRDLYPRWVEKLESLTGQTVGYWPCGSIAPAYDRADFSHDPTTWLSADRIHHLQSGLSAAIQGGWWFPLEAQVDNRQLAQVLRLALQDSGVEIRDGVTVETIAHNSHKVRSVATPTGNWQAQHYIIATGSWSGTWASAGLTVPVTPRKGQLLSVQVPDLHHLPLTTILFGADIYIVPRQDGRIIIGATSEPVGFTPGNTAGGIERLLQAALRLMPALQDYAITETWWGYRPETPDEHPILGESGLANLTLATGHYRNGILLTPITGKLIADWVYDRTADPLLHEFSGWRFDQQK
jgi:glycine oxidase ThiO